MNIWNQSVCFIYIKKATKKINFCESSKKKKKIQRHDEKKKRKKSRTLFSFIRLDVSVSIISCNCCCMIFFTDCGVGLLRFRYLGILFTQNCPHSEFVSFCYCGYNDNNWHQIQQEIITRPGTETATWEYAWDQSDRISDSCLVEQTLIFGEPCLFDKHSVFNTKMCFVFCI